MKTLIKSQKWHMSIFVTFISMLVLGMNVKSYALPVSDRTPEVRDAIVQAVPNISDAAIVTTLHLAAITSLNLRNAGITALKKGDFSDMTGLTSLNLYNNQLSSLPDGIFAGLTSLTTIRLGRNSVDPFPLTVSLEKVGTNQFKAVVPAGATFDIVLPITVTNGSISSGATTLTVSQGSVESGLLTVTRTPGTTAAVTADIGTLPSLPRNHYGYVLTKSDALPIEIISGSNTAPVFTDGTSVTRSVAEGTAASTNIGTAIAATDAENDTLTYTLSGTDASAFDIDSTTGQLKTKAALDYETKTSYTVTLTVSDGGLTDTITVTINVTDVDEDVSVDPPTTPDPPTTNSAPVFTEGDSTTRVIAENTAADTNIGNAVLATDADNDSLTYTLGGVDANTFDLDSSGQLKTKAPLDYETKRVYLVTITADDGELSSTITVIISVIDVNDTVLSAGFVPVADRTAEVRDAIVAAVPNVTDATDVTESQVAAITNLNLRNKGIASLKTGDFSGMTALTNLNLFGNQLSSLPAGTFNGLTALSLLRLGSNAVDPLPLIVSLQQTSDNTFKAVITTGAPFNVVLPIRVTNGSISGGTTAVTISQGATESTSFTVIGIAAEVSFGTLPRLPRNHFGYELAQTTVCNRTTQVAAAIAKAVGVSDCSAVTEVNLATITTLDLSGQSIASLSAGDFDGMLSLRSLSLRNNDLTSLPSGIFDDLVSLRDLFLNSNKLTTVPGGIFSNLTSLTNLYLQSNDLSSLPSDAFDGLSALSSVNLQSNDLTSLPGDVFDGMPYLSSVLLSNNKLTSVPNGIFEGLTQLTQLHLSSNPNPSSQLSLQVSLQKVGTNQVKAVAPSGAPFTIEVPIIIKNGTLAGGVTVLRIPIGTVESLPITVTRTAGTTAAVTADIGTLPNHPSLHNGYALAKSTSLPLEVFPPVNSPPVFTEGATTTRTVAENTDSGTNIGNPVAATDADNDTLTYTISGTDEASFSIVTTTGQLQTSAALNYESKNSYSVTVTASDGSLSDTISVTINVTNVNEAPTFTEGNTATRSVAENTAANTNIGSPVAATDVDANTTFSYTLGGTDASSFGIVSTTGQLQTSAALDYETKNSYSVTVAVSDGSGGTDSIAVTINVTNVDETPANRAPTFTDGTSTTRLVAENVALGTNVGTPVAATDTENDTLTYTISGTDEASFLVDDETGQIRTSAAIDYEVKSSYTVTVNVTDSSNNSDSITVTINVTDVTESVISPALNLRTPAVRDAIVFEAPGVSNVADVTVAHLAAITKLILNAKSLTLVQSTDFNGLTGLTGLGLGSNSLTSVSPLSGLTQLTSLNLSSNSLTDISALSGLTNLTELDLSSNSISNISNLNGLTNLTYLNLSNNPITDISSLSGMTSMETLDLRNTNISSVSALSGMASLSNVYIAGTSISDYAPLRTLMAANQNLVIDININNKAPAFTDGTSTTRSVAENTKSGENIGSAVAATDTDNDTLTYTLGGTDAAAFDLFSTTGQLQTKAALDYETKSSYSVTITVSDGNGGTDSITVVISVTDVDETPTNNGPVSNAGNSAPVFAEGNSTTRSVAENTGSGVDIGTAVSATDPDNDTLTYNLGGTDAASFSINSTNGQLLTNAPLDYETQSSYAVTITVSDSNGGSDSIAVTINVTDVTEPISPSISSRTPQVRAAIVSAAGVQSTDDVTVTHLEAILSLNLNEQYIRSLKAGDFNGLTALKTLNLSNNYISDISALENLTSLTGLYLSDNSISDISTLSGLTQLTHLDLSGNSITDISALSGMTLMTNLHLSRNSLTDLSALSGMTAITTLSLDYNLIFDISALSGMTKMISLNLRSNNVGDISALSGMTLMETLDLWSNKITDVSAVSAMTSLSSLSVEWNPISDFAPLRTLKAANPSLSIDINLNNNAPVFTEGTSTTRSIPERTASGTNIGNPVAATDADNHTLNYSLSGTDANSFSIDPDTGQLQTFAALDYETKKTYTVTITVFDDNNGGDKITVTINVTDVSESAPVFTDGTSTTRSVAENSALGTNVGTPVAATDADNDTLTYTLSGTDEASFSVDDSSGQILTTAVIDYEVKNSYTVIVNVTDSTNSSASITVTINVTDETESTISPALNLRTAAVRDAIVAEALGVSNVADVTAAHLAAITKLDLNNKSLTSVQSTDFNGLTGLTELSLGSNSLTSISVLSGLTQLITLRLNNNSLTDISALSGLTNLTELDLSSNSITNISALSGLTNLTYLNLSSNSITDISALSGMTSMETLDLKNNNITNVSALSGMTSLSSVYIAGTSISDYAPLQTLLAANPNLVIDLKINNSAPTFTEGTRTTRSVAENTKSSQSIGSAVAATDADNDTLTYTLGGTDAAAFGIFSTNGRLQTKAALDYEKKSSYTVTITVDDGNNGSDSIDVTINVTNVNDPPTFTDGSSTIRFIAADAASGTNIGDAIVATDQDTGDTLAYTLGGTDAASFSIVSTSGQLQTKAALDENTESYSVTVSVSDGNGGSDSITVTIEIGTGITPVKDRTTQVRDAIVAAVTGVTNADDVTEAHLAAITELNLASKSITALQARDFTGLTGLQTLYLNHTSGNANEKNSISDISMLEGLNTLTTLNLSDNLISDISALSGMTSMSELSLDNNSISDISTLSGMASMTELSMTNNNVVDLSPLSNMTSLSSLSVAGNPISNYATIRTLQSNSLATLDIGLTNNPPTFTEGATTTRRVRENTAAGEDIGDPVAATDADNHTLSYSLGGTDADSFSIVSTSGQIQTKAALHFPTKNSYTVTVTAYDGNNGGDRITVTIRVLADISGLLAPSLESSVIPENTALLSNYPNPFNPETWIPYQLAKPAEVTLTIYDIRGRVVRTLILGNQPAGVYQSRSKAAHWDGRNHFGEKVATGVYFYTLKAGDFSATRKMLIRK